MIWDDDKYLYASHYSQDAKSEMHEKYKNWSADNCVVK